MRAKGTEADKAVAALIEEGLAHHRLGRLAEAEAHYRRALGHVADHADALHLAGLAAFQSGRAEAALPDLARAAAAAPQIAQYHADHALAAMTLGRPTEAGPALRRGLALEPARADAWSTLSLVGQATGEYKASLGRARRSADIEALSAAAQTNLGTLLAASRDPVGAAKAFSRALRLNPDARDIRLKLAGIHQDAARLDQALVLYDDGLARDPLVAELHNNRGNILLAQRRYDAAISAFRRAAAITPGLAEVFNNLGNALMSGTDQDDAGPMFQRALAAKPGLAEAGNGLGRWLYDRERYAEARKALEGALALKPEQGEFHANLAAALRAAGELDGALIHAQAAVALAPAMAEAHNNMASVALALGDSARAVASYGRTLALVAGVIEIHRNLLTSMLYIAGLPAATLFAEHRRFAAKFAQVRSTAVSFANARDPDRRLTIGYLSSDFRHHPIARNVWPWLSDRDPDRFRVVAFADVQKPDHVTEQLKALVDGWQSVGGLTDAEAARLIRREGVDVLVILASHFDRNRGLVAAHQPAPVVISAHDGTTSAVPGMGYLLADLTVVPRRAVERFTERVVRVPVFSIQRPIDGAPELAPPPVLAQGRITFGSFNNPSKITAATVRLWAGVLNAVPDSRLMMKYRNALASARLRERLYGLFRAEGIAPERLMMVSSTGAADPVGAHLALYNHVDIALDTVPFNGSTTTFEALWMGVPVVTLLGDTMMSRWAASMLVRVGRPYWVALDEAGYVARAAEWSRDLDGLAALRATLRAEVAASRLCETGRSVRHLERVYRALWRRWCRSQTKAAGE
jgi:protein O-GlcNAc transferase